MSDRSLLQGAVFSGSWAASLPPHQPYDCAIYLPSTSPHGCLFSLSAPERALKTGTPLLLCLQPSRSCKVLHEIELRQCLASCFGWVRGTSGRQLIEPLRGILNIWCYRYLACPIPRARPSSKHSSITNWKTWSINLSLCTWMTSQFFLTYFRCTSNMSGEFYSSC